MLNYFGFIHLKFKTKYLVGGGGFLFRVMFINNEMGEKPGTKSGFPIVVFQNSNSTSLHYSNGKKMKNL